ncbi:MAG TPA: Na+/H+ antiporter NhaC family protein [Phycisphaerae bacterium]|nr:Na+/H+ antiporter NhaC family protein [Phycisphaerae bacterium]
MFRVIALLVISLLIVVGAWFGHPDEWFLARQWAVSQSESALRDMPVEPGRDKVPVVLVLEPHDVELEQAVHQRVRASHVEWVDSQTSNARVLKLDVTSEPHSATVGYSIDDGPRIVRRVGWYSVLPPLLAIVTAILFRRVILCLALGILAGGIITVWPMDRTIVGGVWYAIRHYLIEHSLLDQFRAEILLFILLISAIVGVAQQSGGIQGVIEIIIRFCRTARAAQVGTAIGGIAIFFDDYLNCIIVGNSFRPLTDRFRVSREKLSYIVDSTAAPMAGLAVVSTWIAFEVSQIGEGLAAAGITAEPFSIFFRSLPYRFYCMLTLLFVFVLVWTGRDFGPMLEAERRARRGEGNLPAAESAGVIPAAQTRPGLARYAIIPIGFTLVAVFVGLWWTALPSPGEPPLVGRGETALGRAVDYTQQVLARTNSARAFAWASGLGYLLAVGMVLAGRALTPRQIAVSSLRSARVILGAIVILFLAWSIGAACRDVGTADYLVSLFRKVLSPVGFSIVVFGLASLIAFATGSSYSTMAILLPNVVPLALAVGESSPLTGMGLVVISVGAVLEGAIFGDHCSPISDTTILSSVASQCDLMDHVRTQMPYAVACAAVSMLAGYVPVSLGVSPFVCLLFGTVAIVLLVCLLGRKTETPGGGHPLDVSCSTWSSRSQGDQSSV